MIIRLLIFLLAFIPNLASSAIYAQTPPTGKSYSSDKPQRPATTAPQFPSPVTFTDISKQTGINFKHESSPTSQKYLLETMGAGVGLIDYDNDGRLDIFLTNGAHLPDPMPKGKMPDKSDPKFWNRLYRQKSDGKFEDVTEKAGVKGAGYGFGVAVGDYDRDGFADLFVTHYGGAVLYRNNGDGTFTDSTKKLGITVDGWATSAGFFDYDRDGRLDLLVTRYVVWDFETGALVCGDARPGYRAYCHPDNFKGSTALLFHQKTEGTFENVSEKSGITQTKGKSLGVAFADFDDDGWTDIFIANDNSEQQFFRNLGDGRFEDSALAAGVAYDDKGKYFSGMGVDAADYDGDGRQDVFITALSNETYPLYRNTGEMLFDYVTQSSGVAQITILGAGWGVKWIDADNDGRRDLFVAQSHVLDTIEKTNSLLKYKQSPLLMRNTEKGFQNVSLAAGDVFKTDLAARGMAAGDLDNDGDTDVIISQTNGAPVILRNNGTKNHWIGIDLRGGAKSPPNGDGARIIVTDANGRKQFFDASNSGSYLAANDPRIIVGLGVAASVKQIEIRWTSGKVQTLENPLIDRYHSINEK
ncbi:MAG: CRTAC1 family protein [Acidobacteriota bacterium]|nr:CRTAC1 family protein [Acidobacteriota bacterium]